MKMRFGDYAIEAMSTNMDGDSHVDVYHIDTYKRYRIVVTKRQFAALIQFEDLTEAISMLEQFSSSDVISHERYIIVMDELRVWQQHIAREYLNLIQHAIAATAQQKGTP